MFSTNFTVMTSFLLPRQQNGAFLKEVIYSKKKQILSCKTRKEATVKLAGVHPIKSYPLAVVI